MITITMEAVLISKCTDRQRGFFGWFLLCDLAYDVTACDIPQLVCAQPNKVLLLP